MTGRTPTDAERRVLVVAPIGRDAQVTCELLRTTGFRAEACASLAVLAIELKAGAGAILITTEALATEGAADLGRVLSAQEPWSDIPIVFAAEHGNARAPEPPITPRDRPGTVTVLERPIRVVTLRTVLEAALEARLRQYQLRDLVEDLRRHVGELDAERVVRERFVSLLAHDLRGPLSTAMLAARLLTAMPPGAEVRREHAERVERSMIRMDRMIRDLLDANRVRAGERLSVQLEPCDLVAVVHDALGDLDAAGRARVVVRGPDRLPGLWAPEPLRRAAWNLVSNALKYGPAGGRVEVVLTSDAQGVALAVHDDGGGIPPEEQQRIFEPFGRAHGAEQRGGGWGLGLALVRGCAEAHGGTLSVESSPQAGTTFVLRLPPGAAPFAAG